MVLIKILNYKEIATMTEKALLDKEKRNSKKPFSVYSIAEGKPGKKYTIKEFLKIYDSAKKRNNINHSGAKQVTLDDGYVCTCDSDQEYKVLNKLIYHDYFKRLRTQAPAIEYKFGGKTHLYYPDFFFITNTNKIVIMEVKEIIEMNRKVNIRKYKALRQYCKENGFLFLMCNKKFVTYEQIKNKTGSVRLNKVIEDALNRKGRFDYGDYTIYIDCKSHKEVMKIRDFIGIYVASHPETRMVGDLNFGAEYFKIIRKKNA